MKAWIVAWRSLARRPGFAAAALLILALGIGANTSMFSLVDAVLLRPLPYPAPDRLVAVFETSPAKHENTSLIAPVRLEDWNRMNRTFVAIAGSTFDSVTDTSGREPERLSCRRVSPRYFSVFESKPELGRTFTHEEELFGGPAAVVISDALWTRRFNRDPAAVGKRLTISGASVTIVGVMPPEFANARLNPYSSGTDVWLPLGIPPNFMRRDDRFLSGIGRLKPGVTPAQAQDDLARVESVLAQQFPQSDAGWSAVVRSLKEQRVGDYRQALLMMFGAVGFLLLIALANIAALMLTQLHRRERELAIRSSIGATRRQIVGTVMREVLLIVAAGVALGCTVAVWLTGVLQKIFTDLPASAPLEIDWRALGFAAFAGAIAALLCGLIPALQATRSNVVAALSQGGRGDSGARHKWQSALVAVQISLAVLLLAGAGLMLRTYYNLSHVDLGFDPSHALTFHMGATWSEDRAKLGVIQANLLDKLESLPAVEGAGFANFLPASGATLRYQVKLQGSTRTLENGQITVGERGISHDYFKALGVGMLAGEQCPELRAVKQDSPKALVNRRFTELYTDGQMPIGQQVRWTEMAATSAPMEIVGVVNDLREDAANAAPVPYIYVCLASGGWPDPEYVVRTHGDPRPLLSAIRPAVRSVDPSRAIFALEPLDDFLQALLEQPRVNSRMLAAFAFAALALACIGLYTLVSLVVTGRRREIGVRMTLGAEPGRIMSEILAGVARLLAIGIGAGLVITLLMNKVLRSLLFGVGPADLATLVAVVFLLVIIALLATFFPARSAARIDPLEAIRTE
jgi:putative ABC transport system permease protein